MADAVVRYNAKDKCWVAQIDWSQYLSADHTLAMQARSLLNKTQSDLWGAMLGRPFNPQLATAAQGPATPARR